MMRAARRKQGRVVDGIELVLFPDSDAVRYYGVTDPDDHAWMLERLTPHPWKCFEQPLRAHQRGRARPDPAVRTSCARRRWRRATRSSWRRRALAGRLWDIDTGHDLMITEPEAVAEALLQIAER